MFNNVILYNINIIVHLYVLQMGIRPVGLVTVKQQIFVCFRIDLKFVKFNIRKLISVCVFV